MANNKCSYKQSDIMYNFPLISFITV